MNKLKIISDISTNAIRSSEKYFKINHNDLYNEILYFTNNITDIQFKTRIWHWINNIDEAPLCLCGNRTKFNGSWSTGSYLRNCSIKCSSTDPIRIEKNKNTLLRKYGVDLYLKTDVFKYKNKEQNLEKYGVDHYSKTDEFKSKFKKTNLEKYGVDHYSKTDEFKIRVKETSINRYGVDNIFKLKIFRDKFKNTMLLKYGVENPMQYNKFKKIRKVTCLEKYGSSNHMQSDSVRKMFKICNNYNYIKYIGDNISEFYCEKGHNFEIFIVNYHARLNANIPLCTVCNPIGDSKSIKEKELLDYIKSIYIGEIISSYRDGLEIDIYLPELKIGFEFNGLYWHSEKFKDKNYHLDKTNYFKEKEIRIIHIWEDDWTFKRDIVESQIKNLLGLNSEKIFARKCLIKLVSVKDVKQFLDDNHIQGMVSSQIKIGLYYNDELVSLMTFNYSEGRKKMEDGGYNLNRFCNKTGINVIGSASKLLNYFIKNYKPTRIVSYADKDWSIGNLYEILGFENIGGNGPDYKYIVDNQRVHKSRYRKSKLNTTLTETKYMNENGFRKIYDCGKLKFEKVL